MKLKTGELGKYNLTAAEVKKQATSFLDRTDAAHPGHKDAGKIDITYLKDPKAPPMTVRLEELAGITVRPAAPKK